MADTLGVVDCPKCKGSGGGPDPALHCSLCGGMAIVPLHIGMFWEAGVDLQHTMHDEWIVRVAPNSTGAEEGD